MDTARALPVLMYHYISNFSGPINVTPDRFAEHCRGMAEHGWRGIGLDEAEAWLRGEASLPAKSVLITFDDGFLDNYVYAWPILREWGHKGVVFAVTDRLEQGTESTQCSGSGPGSGPGSGAGAGAGAVRPTLAGVRSGQVHPDALPPVDHPLEHHPLGYARRVDQFMNWDEARLLDRDGTVAIAAHTARHELVFASATHPGGGDSPDAAARCFHIPGPHGNTFYRLTGDIPWGMPRFAERPAMSGPAFLPSPELCAAVRDLVPQQTAAAYAFFQQPDRVRALSNLIDRFAATPDSLGTVEDAATTRCRMHTELDRCASTLERELGHPVRSLCWPWGVGSELARSVALDRGFDVFFETRPGPAVRGSRLAVPRFKVRDKGWAWLRLRLEVYARPLLATAYARLKAR